MKHKNIVKVFWGHEEVINKKLEAYFDNLNLVSNVNYDVEVKVTSPAKSNGIYVTLNITCHPIEEPKNTDKIPVIIEGFHKYTGDHKHILPEPVFPPNRDTRHG